MQVYKLVIFTNNWELIFYALHDNILTLDITKKEGKITVYEIIIYSYSLWIRNHLFISFYDEMLSLRDYWEMHIILARISLPD